MEDGAYLCDAKKVNLATERRLIYITVPTNIILSEAGAKM